MHIPDERRPYTLIIGGPDGFDYRRPITADAAMRIVGHILESGATLEWAGTRTTKADETSKLAEATAEQTPREAAEQPATDEASERPRSKHAKIKAFETAAERTERVRLRRDDVRRLKTSGMTTPQIAAELDISEAIAFADVRIILAEATAEQTP